VGGAGGLGRLLHEYAGRTEKGRLKHQLHRFLTSMHGIPELRTASAPVCDCCSYEGRNQLGTI